MLTPLLKKLKAKKIPTNYRGIMICAILGKLLEIIFILRIAAHISRVQSQLQGGFTDGVSYLHTALLVTETICEFEYLGEDLLMTLLDVEKAFDMVWHDALLVKLYKLGIPAPLWIMMDDWYRGLTAQVRWKGSLSRTFAIQQGTGQGRTFSPACYKVYNNPLLKGRAV